MNLKNSSFRLLAISMPMSVSVSCGDTEEKVNPSGVDGSIAHKYKSLPSPISSQSMKMFCTRCLCLLFMFMAFSSCKKDVAEAVSPLVGSWTLQQPLKVRIVYVVNGTSYDRTASVANGSSAKLTFDTNGKATLGTLVYTYETANVYGARQVRLTKVNANPVVTENFTWNIDGDLLTLAQIDYLDQFSTSSAKISAAKALALYSPPFFPNYTSMTSVDRVDVTFTYKK